MDLSKEHVTIIILNWNGWRDTIECLESVYKSEDKNFHIILVENFSDDESIRKIKGWALGEGEPQIETKFPQHVFPLIPKPIPFAELVIVKDQTIEKSITESISDEIPTRGLIMVHNYENAGFAAGNNLGIKIAEHLFESDYFFLLNNDTVIEPRTISQLIAYLDETPQIGAVTSAIRYYSNPQEFHNVGGKLTPWASCNYFTTLPTNNNRSITFLTGCALMVRKRIFDEIGLLSEKFFFGEEDFEFSWRLRKHGIPVTRVLDSRVYHKVSFSSEKLFQQNLNKVFIYALTRIIDMKDYFSYPVWLFWRWLVMVYSFFWLKFRYGASFSSVLRFIVLINRYSSIYDEAGKTTVERLFDEVVL